MSGYTPAPWELDDELQICAGNKVLAIYKGNNEDDACVMVAAPELKAALEELYHWVEGNVAYGTPEPLATKIEAALRKSERGN